MVPIASVAIWGGATIPLSSGFGNSDIVAVNGYEVGSPQFTESGQFTLPGNLMTFKGRLQAGAVFLDSQSDLGWLQSGNDSIAIRQFNFHQNILGYTFQGITDVFPGVVLEPQVIGRQYLYNKIDAFGSLQDEYTTSTDLMATVFTLPDNWFTMVSNRLDMNIKLNIHLDPSLLGFTSFDDPDNNQRFNFTGAWAGVLDAKAGAAFTSGFVTEPGTTIIDSGFESNPAVADEKRSGGDIPANAKASSGNTGFDKWVTSNDPAGGSSGWTVTRSDYVAYQSGAVDLGMGKGDPVRLTEGVHNANASLNQSSAQTTAPAFFADPNRGNVYGYIPMSIRPQTTITNSEYRWNYIYYKNDFWGINPDSKVTDTSNARTTVIQVKNRWIMQAVNFSVIVAANYHVFPLNCVNGTCTEIEPPIVTGTNNTFNPAILNKIDSIGGGAGDLWGAIGDFFGQFWWIAVVVVALVILYFYIKHKGGKGGSSGGVVTNIINVPASKQ